MKPTTGGAPARQQRADGYIRMKFDGIRALADQGWATGFAKGFTQFEKKKND